MDTIEEFRIDIPRADLDDVRELAGYWRTSYDWRVHERRLDAQDRERVERLYYEAARSRSWGPPAPSTAPTGVAVFPEEIAPPVRGLAEQSNNIVDWSEFGRGGHFAAMEEPDLLVGDVRAFFRQFR